MKKHHTVRRGPLVPERVRTIDGGFAFIPNRFLQDGFLAALTADEALLYLVLVLAADRAGMSFYHYDTLCGLLRFPIEQYLQARNGLIRKDLVAFDGARFQVLQLPSTPPPEATRLLQTEEDFENNDSATIRASLRALFGDET